jgi:hypothetical protein
MPSAAVEPLQPPLSAGGRLSAGGGRDCAYPSLGWLSGDRLHCAFYRSASPSHTGASEIHGLVLADRSASS